MQKAVQRLSVSNVLLQKMRFFCTTSLEQGEKTKSAATASRFQLSFLRKEGLSVAGGKKIRVLFEPMRKKLVATPARLQDRNANRVHTKKIQIHIGEDYGSKNESTGT